MDELTLLTWRVPRVNAEGLEAATLPEKARVEHLRAIRDAAGAKEMAYVPTCQRVVLALLHADPAAPERVQAAYARLGRQVAPPEAFRGRDAFRHLAETASSLDSLVVGEPQVLGQFKDSAQQSDEQGLSGPGLRHVMGLVFRAAKAVRTETDLFKGKVSLVPLTEERVRAHLRDRPYARLAVLGTGQMGLRMAELLLEARPDAELHLVSRSRERADEAGKRLGATAHDLDGFLAAPPGDLDVLACAMRAETPLVPPDLLHRVASPRGLLVLDLAVPRNTLAPPEPRPGLDLVQMDDLTRIGMERRANREAETEPARRVLDRELARIEAEYEARKLAHDLADLARRFSDVAEERWRQAPERLDDAAARKWFEQSVRALLHEATEAVKKAGCRRP